jgi:hypothetical protein
MPAPKDPIKREEWRMKISVYRTGKKLSNEAKQKLSEMKKGIPLPEETRRRQKEAMLGSHHTEEHKRKIGESGRGRIVSEETRINMGNAKRGQKHTEDAKRKISKSLTGKYCREKSSNWKGGISFEPYCFKFDEPLHERCRIFFERVCVECGKTEIENKRKMDVHHVNYDKMVCCNDVKPLFVTLCMSCHPKTQRNKQYWEKHFTDMINEKYNGQCYIPKNL